MKALSASHMIAAGAFQSLYREILGEEIMFEEEIDAMPEVDFETLMKAQILPDELLNRLGSVIEIRPPGSVEILANMEKMESAAGVTFDPKKRTAMARAMSTGMQGMRGIEQYALELAKMKIDLERQ